MIAVGVGVTQSAPDERPSELRMADDRGTDGAEPSEGEDDIIGDPYRSLPSTGLGKPVNEEAKRTWDTVASTVPTSPPRPKQDYSNHKFAKKHPLVTDAVNDVGIYSNHGALDLTSGDVDMDGEGTMVVEMTLRDLATSLPQSTPGMEPIAVYTAHLEYDGGELVLEVHRRRDGVFAPFGVYRRTMEQPGGFESGSGKTVRGLTAAVDVDKDTVSIEVDLATLNAGLFMVAEPLAKGSVVVPWFGAGVYSTPTGYWGGTGTTLHHDEARSTEANFAYRLGD